MPDNWKEKLKAFYLAGAGAATAPLKLAAVQALEAEDKLTAALPADATLAGFLTAPRKEARDRFYAEVRQLHGRMRELLAVDDAHSPSAGTPEFLSAAMGNEADVFFDTGALSQALRRPAAKTFKRMDADRRTRIEAAVEALGRALAQESAPCRITDAGSVKQTLEATLDEFTQTLRAMRAARLEAENAFDAEVHEPRLRWFDWRAAPAGEMRAMPMVIAFEEADRMPLTLLGELLQSGAPVQVVLFRRGLGPDIGYVAMAHRECFVTESSVASPDHLLPALAAMGQSLRPAVAVITADPLLHLARAYPGYVYNPDNGDTWAHRLQWQERAPVEVKFSGKSELLTAAHASPAGHLLPVPPEAWDSDQIPLSEYLVQPKGMPYIWALDSGGGLERAIVSRELAMACVDRRRAWRFLEELAGIGNSFVESAVQATRKQLEAEFAAREAAATESGKSEGTAIAVRRVVAVLTSASRPASSARAAKPPHQQMPAPQPAAQAVAVAEAPAAAPVEEASADPYIDSFLCTSCNDCMKVNARMFLYNGEKQAYLADASAGTFAELVKAAEGCPARCIHVGLPRAGDATATAALVAKSAKFR